jgi:hypothetical protein
MLRRKFLVLFSLFGVGLLLCSGVVFGQSGVVGVEQGDWFGYDFGFEWFSDDENMTVPDSGEFDYLLEGECVRFEVLSVSGSNVTGQFTINYENGTTDSVEGWVDVGTGEGDFNTWLISSGLSENDYTYASEVGELINETITHSTPLGSRETNHIGYSTGNVTTEDYYLFGVDMYWDKQTGVLVEMSIVTEMKVDGNLTTASGGWKLVESNLMETVPEFGAFTMFATALVATVAVFSIKKRLANSKT